MDKENNTILAVCKRVAGKIANYINRNGEKSATSTPTVEKALNGTEAVADKYKLQRFLTAQAHDYQRALQEVQNGRKRSHWIWYIFPQLAVLGYSRNARYYGISGLDEAKAYLAHPILGERLRTITQALLTHTGKDAVEILGGIDAMKVRSCMTLFDVVSPGDIFHEVLACFYKGSRDTKTLDNM